MTHFDIFTLFPGMFGGFLSDSILKRAQDAGVVSVALHNIRDYAEGRHRVTDDTPYGGGGGMVMKPEPIFRAVETVLRRDPGWTFVPESIFWVLPKKSRTLPLLTSRNRPSCAAAVAKSWMNPIWPAGTPSFSSFAAMSR